MEILMKRLWIYSIIVSIYILLLNSMPCYAWTNDQIANAIYKAENSPKYPYGIKSIDTHSNKDYARKICLNTIRNNRIRFNKQSKYKDYIEFLGSRYSPPKNNPNWVRLVNYFLKKGD